MLKFLFPSGKGPLDPWVCRDCSYAPGIGISRGSKYCVLARWVLGFKLGIFLTLVAVLYSSLQCFDTVGWATGRASSL